MSLCCFIPHSLLTLFPHSLSSDWFRIHFRVSRRRRIVVFLPPHFLPLFTGCLAWDSGSSSVFGFRPFASSNILSAFVVSVPRHADSLFCCLVSNFISFASSYVASFAVAASCPSCGTSALLLCCFTCFVSSDWSCITCCLMFCVSDGCFVSGAFLLSLFFWDGCLFAYCVVGRFVSGDVLEMFWRWR
jgi:hypothetical protein